jgi:mono/diheme cytochrome c family protein
MKPIVRRLLLIVAVILVLAMLAPLAGAQPVRQGTDPVSRGKYLTTIAGCIDCHTPLGPDGKSDLTRAFAGGQLFDLGPLGKLFTKNLTPDKETGLGDWTDDQIKIAIRSGVEKNGVRLFPVMPYPLFNSMADADVDAIVAYLRTVPAVKNIVPERQLNIPAESLPNIPVRTGIVAPDPSDTAARGKYLLTAVIACTDCHTPVDPNTGAPIMEKYLAGGQPYEGPWGTIYGGNITPDKETGIGKWSDDDIKRVLRQGILPESQKYRRVILMPWTLWAGLTDQDTAAIVHYLRNGVPPVSNLVPAPKLKEGIAEYVPLPVTSNSNPTAIVIVALVVVGVGLGAFVMLRRRSSAAAK